MSRSRFRGWFQGVMACTTVAAGLTLATGVSAQPPAQNAGQDRANRLNVVAQKAEADVRAALLQAQNLATQDAAKAADRLQKMVVQLEDNNSLTGERREQLLGLLRRRIEALQSVPAEPALNERELQATIRRFEDKKAQSEQTEENEKLRRKLAEILDLQKSGKPAEAKRLADEAVKEFPGRAAAQNAALTAAAFDQLASARTLKKDKEKGVVAALNDVERSAIPLKGDIEFPKDWKERSQRREMFTAPKLTPRERAVLQALNTPVTVNFKGERFQDVMEYLSTLTGQPIVFAQSDLNDASITYDTPVSLAVKGVTARTVLRKILNEFGLSYIVKDGTIQVVTAAKARETMVTRTYYIGDLLATRGGPGDPLTNIFGPGIGQIAAIQNLASVVEMLQTSIDPSSWQANNGPGAIYFHLPSMSLVVKQSAEVHAMIAGGFLR